MRKFFKYFFITLLSLVVVAGSGYYFYINNYNKNDLEFKNKNKNAQTAAAADDKLVNVLLLGVDHAEKDDVGRSDTMILVSYNPANKQASLISIPRDTRVYLGDKYGYQKINAAYAFYGADKSCEEVSKLLNIQIDNYAIIDLQAFIKIVDDFGGIDFNVPMNMEYGDYANKLPVGELKKGMQHLNGQQALGLVRFREGYVDQDLGREKIQRDFITTLMHKVIQPSSIFKIKSLYDIANKYIKTNISSVKMLSYIYDMYKVDKDSIKTATLPGEPQYIDGISYFIIDRDKAQESISKLTGAETALNNSGQDFTPSAIKVEIENGCGVEGAATKVSDIVKEDGFNITDVINADNMDYATTQIINRTGNTSIADKIKSYFNDATIVTEQHDENEPDVTIIVGKNYAN